MTLEEMKDLRDRVIPIVKEAGSIVNNTVISDDMIEQKGTANFVTKVDYAVEKFLVEKIIDLMPDSNIITEEAEKNRFNFDKPTWIIDPIDGTTNLMYSFGLSGISIGFFVEGKASIGWVYNPYTDEMFSAVAGVGAWLNEKPIKKSSNKTLKDSLIGFGTSPYNKENARRTFETVESIYLEARDIRRCGAASLDICYVACGRMDGFYEMKLQPWDYAGGLVVLNEVGGKITDWEGREIDCLSATPTVASNGYIHDELLKKLSKAN